MELALIPPTGKEPWTAVVAWARPWHRPVPARRSTQATAPPDPDPEPNLEIAWNLGLIELRAAELALAEMVRRADADARIDGHVDEWPELMARHTVFRARQRLRLAQEALTGADAALAWSTA